MCLGVPAKLVEVSGMEAVADFGGVRRRILLGVSGVKPGDWVMVHAGVAIGRLDPVDAEFILEALAQLQEANQAGGEEA